MEFSGESVIKIFRALEDQGVPVWLDGGWATDALLKKQTREHSDLDLIAPIESIASAEAVLGTLGFRRDDRETNVPTRVVFKNPDGLEIDVHPVTFSADGTSIHIDEDYWDQKYVYVSSAAGLSGVGTVAGRVVRCITAAEQIRQKVERRYSPWSPDRIDANGVSADLKDIISLLEIFGVNERDRGETGQTGEARTVNNPVVKAAEQFSLRHVETLSAQYAELSAKHAELSAEHARLVEEHTGLRTRYKRMRRSISWRLTAPVRRTAEWLGLGLSKLKTH